MKFSSLRKPTVWVSLLVAGAIAFSGTTLYLNHKAAQEEALIYQLKQLRMGIQVSVKLNGQVPESLEAMVETPFQLGNKIEWKIQREPTGRLVDPFGSAYAYDPLRGWVSSTTAGYESW